MRVNSEAEPALVDLLRLRGLPLSDSDQQRILFSKDSVELERW